MNLTEISGFVLALLVMLLGLMGAVLPGLPGTPLIFLAAFGHKLWLGDRSVSWWIVALMGGITLVTVVVDYLATAYGAQRMGATWRGVVGAVVGAVFGLLWLPFGLIIGPFVGAMLLEMVTGKEWRAASRAGLGAMLGLLAGTLGKVAAGLGMIALWALLALWQALGTK